VVIPGILLLIITRVSNIELASQLSDVIGALPTAIQEHVKGESGPTQAAGAGTNAFNWFVPGLLIQIAIFGTAFVGFGLYSLIVNLLVGPKVGGWFFPTTSWVLLMFWVLPPFICLALAMILAISARVSSAAAAQQSSALVTLPLILIAYSVASGSMFEGNMLAILIGAGAWIGAILALTRSSKAVRRERLLGMGG